MSSYFYFVSFHSAGGGARQIGISDMYNLKSCKYGQHAARAARHGREGGEGGRRAG